MSNNINYIVRRRTPCYYCSELVDERYLPEHVTHCGAVLEECPNKCGAYIQRNNLKTHRGQCSVRKSAKMNKSEEIKPHESSNDSIWKERVMSILNLLRTTVAEGKKEQKELEERFKQSLASLRSKEAAFEALRVELSQAKNVSSSSNDEVDYRIGRLEQTVMNIDEQISLNFKQAYDRLESIQKKFIEEEITQRKNNEEWREEIEGFRTFLNNENVMISAVWHEQLKQIHDLKLELEMRCKDSKKLVNTHDLLKEKIDVLVAEMNKQSEAIASQVAETKALKFQLKENVNYLEDIIKEIASQNSPENSNCRCVNEEYFQTIPTNGRLLWRIDRYKEKMTDAKENDAVLYSPIFYNKEYGYTLRVELLLNGKGQWKDRHVIGCLKVIEGKWDALLDWPCILQANVVLRDQENPANNVKKMLKVRRKDAVDGDPNKINKESGIYMFIPHTKLTRHDGFTKNNILFLDIQVKDVKIGGSMASLIS